VVDENVETLVIDDSPDLVGISVWTTLAPRSYRIAAQFRELGVPVVLGGVHPSLLPGEAARHADSVVVGEAEAVIETLLSDVEGGRLQPLYRGHWGDMSLAPSFDEMRPDYDRIKFGTYRPMHTIQTARGCRYNCDFCSVIRINGRGQRHLDPERVVHEIRERSKMPPKTGKIGVFFTDDDLGSDPEHAAALFEAIIRSGIKMRWGCQTTIGIARDPELLDLAVRSGGRVFFLGLESVSRSSLKEANKKNRPSEYKELVSQFHRRGAAVEAGFIFGFDEDGPSVFEETVEAADEIGVDTAHFTALTPCPGTNTFARYYQEGRIIDFDWSNYSTYRAVFEPARMSAAQLDEGMREAYRLFYGRSRRWRRLRQSMRTQETLIVALYAAMGASYARNYAKRPPRLEGTPAFEPHPDDLADLLATSLAPANEAISVAVDGLVARGGPTPVNLGLPVNRNRLVLDELPVR
jgi:radical SAM superfamily enzyme YgiQ (UPF0313 family)